jgi:hypothetical protein
MDFPQNGKKYVAAGFQLDGRGNVAVVVENRAPFAVSGIVVTPVLVDSAGRVVQQGRSVQIRGPVAAGQRASVNAGFAVTSQEMANSLRMRVDGVRGE